ncbi:MAG: alanine racemase C-terminal domain-containing protein [Clostridia bacterium]
MPDGSPIRLWRYLRGRGDSGASASIPVGYADGYSRRLSGIGHVLIRGHLVPIAGRICMDQFMVDLTSFPDIQGRRIRRGAILFGEGLSVR